MPKKSERTDAHKIIIFKDGDRLCRCYVPKARWEDFDKALSQLIHSFEVQES